MTESYSLAEILVERLPSVDTLLAAEQIPLRRRPFHAALEFARNYILEVQDYDHQGPPDSSFPEMVSKRWFRLLYQGVETWYHQRYGSAFETTPQKTIVGFVRIWGTGFALRVPFPLVETGTPGKTAWIKFPDAVLGPENPSDWLVSPPNLKGMRPSELAKLTAACHETASLLRTIMVRLMGIEARDLIARGFLDGIRFHVESAAEAALQNTPSAVANAFWNIQMACECAYKAMWVQKIGSFLETHDLFTLHDRAGEHRPPLNREILKKVPRWEKMVDLRYGQASTPTLDSFGQSYRAMLHIIAAILQTLVTTHFENAAVEIGVAPWMADDDLFGDRLPL